MTAVQAEAEWSRDYVTFMQCQAGDRWLADAGSQVSAWLREKGFDVDPTSDVDLEDGARQLSIRSSSAGPVRDFSITLREDGDQGRWTTRLLAHDETGQEDWIHLRVSNDQGRFVNAPRLVKRLLQVLPLVDGRLEFTPEPQVFRLDDVDRLVALLADEQRHALVFVAGTNVEDGIPFDKFRVRVARWTHELLGLAQVVVLDPPATAEFARRVGPRLSAPPWSIRTYKPGVDFADPSSAGRHRILGTQRLGTQSDKRIMYLLGEIARQHAADRPPVAAVRAVRRRFERLENRRMVEALSVSAGVEEQQPVEPPVEPVTPPQGRMEELREQVAALSLVKSILKIEEITEKSLRALADRLLHGRASADAAEKVQERVDLLQTRVEELEDSNKEIFDALADQQMETELAQLDLADRDARIRWLESRLKDHEDYEAAYLEVPAEFLETRPADFDELLNRIDNLPGVEFTGDEVEVARVQAVDTNGAALRTAWDAVLTLADYVKARGCGDWATGLDQFIQATPNGYRSFPPGKWAQSETGTTMKGWGDERVFPVPTSVAATGCVEMKAHFKLAKIGMATPRMHVIDCHPSEPVVYIGYIGTHLTNTHT